MGGDLRAARQATSPTFLVGALKDPMGTNRDRIQVITERPYTSPIWYTPRR